MMPAGRSIFAYMVLLTTRLDRNDSVSLGREMVVRMSKMDENKQYDYITAAGRSSN